MRVLPLSLEEIGGALGKRKECQTKEEKSSRESQREGVEVRAAGQTEEMRQKIATLVGNGFLFKRRNSVPLPPFTDNRTAARPPYFPLSLPFIRRLSLELSFPPSEPQGGGWLAGRRQSSCNACMPPSLSILPFFCFVVLFGRNGLNLLEKSAGQAIFQLLLSFLSMIILVFSLPDSRSLHFHSGS